MVFGWSSLIPEQNIIRLCFFLFFFYLKCEENWLHSNTLPLKFSPEEHAFQLIAKTMCQPPPPFTRQSNVHISRDGLVGYHQIMTCWEDESLKRRVTCIAIGSFSQAIGFIWMVAIHYCILCQHHRFLAHNKTNFKRFCSLYNILFFYF